MEDSYNYDHALDGVYDVLSHPTRRALVYVLRCPESRTLEVVADELLELDGEWVDRDGSNGERRWIEVELHHVHLPLMAATDMLEYDPDTGRIRTKNALDVAYGVLDDVAGEVAE